MYKRLDRLSDLIQKFQEEKSKSKDLREKYIRLIDDQKLIRLASKK